MDGFLGSALLTGAPSWSLPVIFFFGALWIGALAFWIWTLVDAIRVPDDSQYQSGTKVVWVLVIVLASLIGSIIYVAVGRPQGGAPSAIAQWNARPAPRPADPGGGIPPPPPPPPPP